MAGAAADGAATSSEAAQTAGTLDNARLNAQQAIFPRMRIEATEGPGAMQARPVFQPSEQLYKGRILEHRSQRV